MLVFQPRSFGPRVSVSVVRAKAIYFARFCHLFGELGQVPPGTPPSPTPSPSPAHLHRSPLQSPPPKTNS